jgi:RNA polymerase sigma-70 factor (ECF subfamily)
VERCTEQELLNRVRRGDRAAREELVVGYYRRVYAMLAHLAGDVHLAEDLTQETFAAALASVDRFSGRSTLATWLYRIAYHKLVDAKRRDRLNAEKTKEFQRQYAIQIQEDTALADFAAMESRRQLYDAVAQMDEDDRLMITLHYFQDLSYRDVASILGRPVGTVKWQINQSLHRLRSRLQACPDAARCREE